MTEFKHNLVSFCEGVDLPNPPAELAERASDGILPALACEGLPSDRAFLLRENAEKALRDTQGRAHCFEKKWNRVYRPPLARRICRGGATRTRRTPRAIRPWTLRGGYGISI